MVAFLLFISESKAKSPKKKPFPIDIKGSYIKHAIECFVSLSIIDS